MTKPAGRFIWYELMTTDPQGAADFYEAVVGWTIVGQTEPGAPVDYRHIVRADGGHWQLENLSVHDGSIFPTSVGANPQLSIYGITNRLAQGLVQRLTGESEALA